MGQDVLILVPQGWYIDECCVKPEEKRAPTAALLMSAYLRALGHRPMVHVYGKDFRLSLAKIPDALIVYAPWDGFRQWTAPVFRAFKKQFPGSTTILVMYESLIDFELQAMVECPEIDYAVLPNERRSRRALSWITESRTASAVLGNCRESYSGIPRGSPGPEENALFVTTCLICLSLDPI